REQDCPASARERLLQVLESLEPRYLLQPRRRTPPSGRHFQQCDSEAGEMPVEQLAARGGVEVRQAELDVASGDADVAQGQTSQQRSERGTDCKLQAEGQEAEQPQRAETDPGGPVPGRQQSCPARRPRERGGSRSRKLVHLPPGRASGDLEIGE